MEPLEDRCVPANASGNITGAAFIDANGNGRRDAGEPAVVGAAVKLIGQTLQGKEIEVAANTRSNGSFNFLNVQPGRYKLQADPPRGVLSGAAGTPFFFLGPGKNVNHTLTFAGLGSQAVSMRQFLNSTTSTAFPFGSSPGAGTAKASARPNNRPTVSNPINSITEDVNALNTIIDLAGHFSDPDISNSRVRLETTVGNIDLELFDRNAPRTVANFLQYVTSGQYDNTIFHRLGGLNLQALPRQVLQGGLWEFSRTGGEGDLTALDPQFKVADEVLRPNLAGTVAMAKTNEANSATSQFFFNLTNNTEALSPQGQTNGGFTVFARMLTPLTDLTTALQAYTSQNKPGIGSTVPLKPGAGSGTGETFPEDTVKSDYVLIKDARVLRRTEKLKYTVVSNSNPTLVTATIVNHRLVLDYGQDQSGTARITVKATDRFGATTRTSFTVTVNP